MRRFVEGLGLWAAVVVSACALENPARIVPTPDVPPPDLGVVVPDAGMPCATGRDDCDGDATNGCEADLTSVTHCGACGVACTAGANAASSCQRGRCVQQCAEGFGDCDNNPDNGCETDVRVSPSHCGRCGVACTASGATPTCRAGVCGVSMCAAGRGDCDGVEGNGCETVLAEDVRHCGACGRMCAVGNGTPSCNAGVCGIAGCMMGFNNCDGDPSNGCESETRSSIVHCGTCGNACPAVPNGSPQCMGGTCGRTCNTGFDDCDGAPTNGCETDTRTSTAHCGACARACPSPANGTTTCVAGACAPRCNTGFVLDGMSCVACGAAGQRPCTGGMCAVGTVLQGQTCVACGAATQPPCAGNVCNTGLSVVGGLCTACGATGLPPCPGTMCPVADQILCNGVCRNNRYDPEHCGRCGNRCAAGVRCSDGNCNNMFCTVGRRDCCDNRQCPQGGTATDIGLGEGRTACVCR